MKPNTWMSVGALSGAITVALGAFGAHALKDSVTPEDLAIWETGVHYQGLHALALVLYGLAQQVKPKSCIAGPCFLAGSVIFSGTLYAMTLGAPRWFGAITPIGGVLLIVGWIALAVSRWRAG